MTINQKIFNFLKNTLKTKAFSTTSGSKILIKIAFLLISIILFITLIYFISDGLVQKKMKETRTVLIK